MATYYNPNGNPEVWDEKPNGYFTPEEWAAMHPAPEPTKKEKLDALDSDYMAQKSELVEQYTDAQIHSDGETMAAIVDEMTALDEWYDTEYQKIIDEEGE